MSKNSARPRVFIASPLFNAPQIAIIQGIEKRLTAAGFDFYSARLHSGSDQLSPEDRKDIRKWDPVFESNEDGLYDCRVMIAVLEYALPGKQQIFLCDGEYPEPETPLSLPDAGTVWEMGHFRTQGKLVLGFHTNKAGHLNLMLTHGVDGMLLGFDALEKFLVQPERTQLPTRLGRRCTAKNARASLRSDSLLFDWSATSDWDASTKEVE